MKKFRRDLIDTFHRLIDEPPVQHGTPPPTDQELMNSHPVDCFCPHCSSMESPEQNDENNQIWIDSILNENQD